MNTPKLFVGLIALLAIISLAACAPAPTLVPPTAAPVSPTAASVSVTVTDSAKRTVTIPAPPQRIVSLAPSTTEIAFALGLGNRVVAVDTFSDYPAETKDLPKFKTRPLNFEQIVMFKPDLVLAASLTKADDVKKLADLNLTVLVVGSTTMTLDNVSDDIQLVGKATGTEAKAKAISDSIKQKVEAIKAKMTNAQTKPRVYWELDATDPTKPYTPGPGSFVNDLITIAGGVNVGASAKSSWAQINAEEIVAANPDIIILNDAAYGISPDSVKARKGWATIGAVKNDKVFPIDDNLVSRASPRLADGLEAAAKLIHPELFK